MEFFVVAVVLLFVSKSEKLQTKSYIFGLVVVASAFILTPSSLKYWPNVKSRVSCKASAVAREVLS